MYTLHLNAAIVNFQKIFKNSNLFTQIGKSPLGEISNDTAMQKILDGYRPSKMKKCPNEMLV